MFWKKLLEPQISVDRSGSAVRITQRFSLLAVMNETVAIFLTIHSSVV